MKKLFVVFFLVFPFYIFSCDCPELSKINSKSVSTYDVIFYGKVDSVTSCNTEGVSKAYFVINELYKGESEKNIIILFDCQTDCMMSFAKNENWLIYANYQKFNLLSASFCGHSRKQFSNPILDTYSITSEQSFEDEIKFLQTNLGLKEFIIRNEINEQLSLLKPHNEQPSGLNKIFLIGISLIVMLLVFFYTRKKH